MKRTSVFGFALGAVLAATAWILWMESGHIESTRVGAEAGAETARGGGLGSSDDDAQLTSSGVARAERQSDSGSGAESNHTDEVSESSAEALGWSEAKDVIRGDFELREKDRETFRKHVRRARVHILRKSESVPVVVDFALDPTQICAQYADALSQPGDDIDESAFAAAESYCGSRKEQLEQLIENAASLYQDALLLYWEREMFVKYREGSTPEYDKGLEVFTHFTGSYNVEFISSGNEWKAHVAFDSDDFPFLEHALVEIADFKLATLAELSRILALDQPF